MSALPGLPGYFVSVWADGGVVSSSNPDSLEWDGTHVWVTYQNNSVKTGGPGEGSSTIVEYSADGQTIVNTWSVAGHSDGMRWDTTTQKIWATSNEDNNPAFYAINPAVGGDAGVTTYTLHWTDPLLAGAVTPHGGGLDDLWFLNGKSFVVGSNPTNNPNTAPALYEWTVSGTDMTLTGVLNGNAAAVDQTGAPVTLNEIDPDSLNQDPLGNLVLVDQAGGDFLTIGSPGTASQSVVRYLTVVQYDDTLWIPSATAGALLVADATNNVIWKVTGPYVAGQIFTELPNDSSVVGVVGTVDISDAGYAANGYATVTPVVIGMGKPTGLLWVPGL